MFKTHGCTVDERQPGVGSWLLENVCYHKASVLPGPILSFTLNLIKPLTFFLNLEEVIAGVGG